jgi:tryptophan halogenase
MHLDRARDFAVLHYKLNGRRGERLWDAFRETTAPALLDYKIRLYQSRGRVAMYDEEPLDEMSWINLFDEHGVRPHHYSPIADGFSAAELEAHVERARTIMIDELKKMPLHADYLSGLRRGEA